MALNMEDMQKSKATLKGQSAASNDAPFSGPVTWDNTNPTVLTITQVSEFVYYLESTGELGSAVVTAHGFDKPGGKPIVSEPVTVNVTPGIAIKILIEFAPPEPR